MDPLPASPCSPAAHRSAAPPPHVPGHTVRHQLNLLPQESIWDLILKAVSKANDGHIQIIDSSSILVHQHAANTHKKIKDPVAWVAPAAG